ncbi:MAG: hypothetical protein IKZ60_04105 [Bacteroidales bacterium]|nr:hypothetical protein [Bacteroidales bacterium]
MKQIYSSPSVVLIECMPECMQGYSGVKNMQDSSVFSEDLDDDLIV